ncbi:MAG: galactokinase [Bacteroidales bacterium]|nr:galactokinase [Bacteroidales bacterium]
MQCERHFKGLYRKDPDTLIFCPYRVCPIGAHSDKNLGAVTGMALDKGIYLAYSPKHNGVIELCSLQFDKRAQWHVAQIPGARQNDWADYLRGACLALSRKYPVHTGLSGVIEGTLPIGGLSSSAAVTLVFLNALCSVNGISPTPAELIGFSISAENDYVGVNSGKLDQSCEMYCRKDHLLYLDTLTDEYELIPASPLMKPYEIAVFFSGVERNLVGSKYNMRIDESRSAAYALKAFSGMEYGKFDETNLREVPREVFERYKDRLPENWRKRATHWYSEFDRVQKGAEAWRRGDIEEYGRLCFESGHSSIYNWETGSPELKAMYDIMTATDGIYGGRFSGAGFKGCCMALIDPSYRESVLEKVKTEYLALFPNLAGSYKAMVCQNSDGLTGRL